MVNGPQVVFCLSGYIVRYEGSWKADHKHGPGLLYYQSGTAWRIQRVLHSYLRISTWKCLTICLNSGGVVSRIFPGVIFGLE